MEAILHKYVVIPIVAIIGIVVVGNIIETALGIQNAPLLLFLAAGGFGGIALFSKSRG